MSAKRSELSCGIEYIAEFTNLHWKGKVSEKKKKKEKFLRKSRGNDDVLIFMQFSLWYFKVNLLCSF